MSKSKIPIKILGKLIGYCELLTYSHEEKRTICFDFTPIKKYERVIKSGKMIFIENSGSCYIFSGSCKKIIQSFKIKCYLEIL
jgi:hypothetical protein